MQYNCSGKGTIKIIYCKYLLANEDLLFWLLTSLLFSGAGRWGQLLYVSLSELLLHQLELKTEKRQLRHGRTAADG
jgi:hypothetical protein